MLNLKTLLCRQQFFQMCHSFFFAQQNLHICTVYKFLHIRRYSYMKVMPKKFVLTSNQTDLINCLYLDYLLKI
jgi:hypothetical protein